jgi:hypothetical protein
MAFVDRAAPMQAIGAKRRRSRSRHSWVGHGLAPEQINTSGGTGQTFTTRNEAATNQWELGKNVNGNQFGRNAPGT